MTSIEVRYRLSKIADIEFQWDDRRKVITVFDFQDHKAELEELGFNCSSPMFTNMTFVEERNQDTQPPVDRSDWVKTSGPDKTPEWALR